MRWSLTLLTLLLPWIARAADLPGLAVTFTNGDNATDATTLPNLALYVEAGQPPTPFLHEGKFLAIWEGNIVADLRSDFFFAAELNGALKFEINGALVLEGRSPGIPLSKPVQLKKGPNSLKAVFTSPAQ